MVDAATSICHSAGALIAQEGRTMEQRETALILGASRGLGRAIADECRGSGMRTIEVARFYGTDGDALARGRERGMRVVGGTPQIVDDDRAQVTVDLSDAESTSDGIVALHKLRDERWWLTHFFWVAGVHVQSEFDRMQPGAIARLVDVNLGNALRICQVAWDELARSDAPRTFTTIASMSGLRARANEAVYCATKWAQVGFTRSLHLEAEELRHTGRFRGRFGGEQHYPDIAVRLFCPGGMRTEMFGAHKPDGYDAFMDPEKVAHYIVSRALDDELWIEEAIERTSELGQSLR